MKTASLTAPKKRSHLRIKHTQNSHTLANTTTTTSRHAGVLYEKIAQIAQIEWKTHKDVTARVVCAHLTTTHTHTKHTATDSLCDNPKKTR